MNLINLCNHLELEGFVVDISKIKSNGTWNIVSLIDNAKGFKSGSFKIINNVCIYHNFKTGVTKTYFDNKTKLTREEKINSYKKIKENQLLIRSQKFKAGREAYNEFNAIINSGISEYIINKKIENFGCKIDAIGVLHVPFRNTKGYISTYQKIFKDGYKIFRGDAEITGCCHQIGFNKIFNNPNYNGQIYIAEGYATAASIHMALNQPTVVAANTGNLIHVVDNIKNKYLLADIIICADNDLCLKEVKKGSNKFIWSNVGVEVAIKCSNKFKVKIVMPEMSSITVEKHSYKIDYNDVHKLYGLDEVRNQINKQLDYLRNKELCQEM